MLHHCWCIVFSQILPSLFMFKLASTLCLTASSTEYQRMFSSYLYVHVSCRLFEQARLTHVEEVEEVSNRCNRCYIFYKALRMVKGRPLWTRVRRLLGEGRLEARFQGSPILLKESPARQK